MHVLVCDDDKSTRFVIRRLLTQKLNCEVTECGDGVEALERLAAGNIELLILDVSMPTLDGVDVLEAIRRSPQHAQLPVIMLSHERREEVVRKLIQLGILGYVVKPPRPEALVGLVERARQGRKPKREHVGLKPREIRLDPQTPALVVDGNPEYRAFFAAHADGYGRVIPAESGLSALAIFKRDAPRLVFIGGDLGVVGGELLVRKLREMNGDEPLRLVTLRDDGQGAAAIAGTDAEMPRTLSVSDHKEALLQFVRLRGPVDDLCAVAGDLADALHGASLQVFGMMLDSEVQQSTETLATADVCGTVDVTVQNQFVVSVELYLSADDAKVLTARMRSLELSAVTEEHVTSAVSEAINLVGGRIQSGLVSRQLEGVRSSPQARHQASMPIDAPAEGAGLHLSFSAGATSASFTVLARVQKRGESSVEASAKPSTDASAEASANAA
jgi:two-component system, chemotaxis family, chemotaxis protein CheY